MSTFFHSFISGELEPFRWHAILLGVAVLGEVLVATGIILESWPPKSVRGWVGLIFVFVGVVISAIFTIALFVFDEGLSGAQQATIASLDRQIAPRRLSLDEQKYFGHWLISHSGKSVRVTSYMLDFEAAFFGQEIIQGLREGGVTPVSSLLCDAPIGGIVVGVHVYGRDVNLVNAILADLAALGVASSPERVPPSIMSCAHQGGGAWMGGPASGVMPADDVDATIFVATKLPTD